MKLSDLKDRVDSLTTARIESNLEELHKYYQAALAVLITVYGNESHQVGLLLDRAKKSDAFQYGHDPDTTREINAIRGVLKNVKEEIDGGFAGSLQQTIAGDILTDFVQLAKEALAEPEGGAKNVAAVLVAAAYEDVIRQMGARLAGVTDRIDLSKVIDVLKNKDILKGPQLGIALSYLKFRNDALHADWDHIELSAVHSLLGFVEQLLVQHFQ